MQARGRRCEPRPTERTAAILDSDGGVEWLWVVARRTGTRTEEIWRLIDKVAAIIEALSLKM